MEKKKYPPKTSKSIKTQKNSKPVTHTKSRTKGITVYIGNLRYTRDEMGVKFLFSPYGPVRFIDLITDKKSGQSKGYAFVKLINREDGLRAIKELNGKQVDGRTLKVSEAVENEETNNSYKSAQKKQAQKAHVDDVIEEFDVPKKKKAPKKKKGLGALKEFLDKK